MYSFNRDGKTAGEFRMHLRGSHYGSLQGGTAIRVSCPKENASEVVHSARSAGRKITLEGVINNSKRLIYAVFSYGGIMAPKEKDQLLKLTRRHLTSHFDKLGYKCTWGPDWLDFEGEAGLVRVSWVYLDPNRPDHRVTVINGMPVAPGVLDEVAIMSWLKPEPVHEGF